MALLQQNELRLLATALITSQLDITASRGVFFQGINPLYKALLPVGLPPNAQVLSDLGNMNRVERLANGDVPLEIYLDNAIFLLAGSTKETEIVQTYRDIIVQRAYGTPKIDIEKVPETKEVIIHRDDMLSQTFMEMGVKAGTSVMKLRVPSLENKTPRTLESGDPIRFNGTGWLITPSLVLTNHHVINARKDEEPDAKAEDFILQAAGTKGYLDFDSDEMTGSELQVTEVLLSDKELDYALLRVPDTGRKPLRYASQTLTLGKEPIAVNIIQHPGGHAKKYAIRNNLVSATTTTEVRYFTDTKTGSSGSPVLNDAWQVVGLHKASVFASSVNFQGKSTAYVNVGTQLQAVLAHIRQQNPALAKEIEQNNKQ